MIKLVIFDWNGTLLADSAGCIAAGNAVIEKFGGTPLSLEAYKEQFDFPSLDFYERQGADREAMISGGYADVFYSNYEENAAKSRTRKGARETLAWLSLHSIDAVILSNHMKDAIENQLRRLSLEGYFSAVLGNVEIAATASGNNKIRRLREYLSLHGYDPLQAMVIGDSPEDIAIGKELGMRTVGIKDGYFSTPRLLAAGPDEMIGSLSEAIGIVRKY